MTLDRARQTEKEKKEALKKRKKKLRERRRPESPMCA
jgi:hypothetical protein